MSLGEHDGGDALSSDHSERSVDRNRSAPACSFIRDHRCNGMLSPPMGTLVYRPSVQELPPFEGLPSGVSFGALSVRAFRTCAGSRKETKIAAPNTQVGRTKKAAKIAKNAAAKKERSLRQERSKTRRQPRRQQEEHHSRTPEPQRRCDDRRDRQNNQLAKPQYPRLPAGPSRTRWGWAWNRRRPRPASAPTTSSHRHHRHPGRPETGGSFSFQHLSEIPT
jgi:hypothetical protein